MFTVTEILLTAGVKYSVCSGWAAGNIYVTDANQLIGAWKDLDAYRKEHSQYTADWQAHHVLEDDDLDRLGVSNHAAAYKDQLCVLLPSDAHIKRINSILRRENPTKYQATAKELLRAYREAYSMMGDYCGGGEANIQDELMRIVKAQFQKYGVR